MSPLLSHPSSARHRSSAFPAGNVMFGPLLVQSRHVSSKSTPTTSTTGEWKSGGVGGSSSGSSGSNATDSKGSSMAAGTTASTSKAAEDVAAMLKEMPAGDRLQALEQRMDQLTAAGLNMARSTDAALTVGSLAMLYLLIISTWMLLLLTDLTGHVRKKAQQQAKGNQRRLACVTVSQPASSSPSLAPCLLLLSSRLLSDPRRHPDCAHGAAEGARSRGQARRGRIQERSRTLARR